MENIQRWIRKNHLIRLKNGLYVTRCYLDRAGNDPHYRELVANTLLFPSYLSTEYVLQKHNLLTDISWPLTSMTLKTPRRFTNPFGSFIYHHLQPRLYFGFEKHGYGQHPIYEATIPKALFDLFYLRLPQLETTNVATIEELRLTWSELPRKAFAVFCRLITQSGIKKMEQMIPQLMEVYDANARR